MSSSLFVALTTLLKDVRAGDGTPQTEVFLNVCRQVIPVIGGLRSGLWRYIAWLFVYNL